MLTDQEANVLGQALGALVQERGLGAISKKDYELLVFHHLAISSGLGKAGNYELANKLKVPESRIKALRLEASLRHAPANHKAVLGSIVQRIIDELNRPEFAGDIVSITLENPIDRREFEQALKAARHMVEYGLNREILKIAPMALFEVILANVEQPEKRFKEIVQSCIKVKKRQNEILDASLTFRQRVNKVGQEVSSSGGAVAMLSAAASVLV